MMRNISITTVRAQLSILYLLHEYGCFHIMYNVSGSNMEKILDKQELILQYQLGFGAWTYHLRIPNTAHLRGKWGLLKVSGTIDDVEIKNINLAPRKDGDRIISINQSIRDTLGKGAGERVLVTLYLHI